MKKNILFLALLISMQTTAQPVPGYNGKAKTFVEKFWKLAEELKSAGAGNAGGKAPAYKIILDKARVQLKYVKEKDPAYDVTAMEQLLKPYEDGISTSLQEKKEALTSKIRQGDKEGDGCAAIFMANTTVAMPGTGDLDADIASHIKQLNTYNEKVNRILSGNMDGTQVCEDYIRNWSAASARRIDQFFKETQTEHIKPVKFAYRELLGEEAYWNAAHKIYPAMPEAAAVYKKIKELLTSLGSMDEAAAKAVKKRQERLKNTFMPKAAVVSAAIEVEFKKAFINEGWNETIVKINIVSRDWNIVRHQVSGVIICRVQSAAIVAKQKNGNCILYDYTIKQQYTGSGYSSVSSRYTHDVIEDEFLCENAK